VTTKANGSFELERICAVLSAQKGFLIALTCSLQYRKVCNAQASGGTDSDNGSPGVIDVSSESPHAV
jgi:hypothetical protein